MYVYILINILSVSLQLSEKAQMFCIGKLLA